MEVTKGHQKNTMRLPPPMEFVEKLRISVQIVDRVSAVLELTSPSLREEFVDFL